jgi:hypothetical protein
MCEMFGQLNGNHVLSLFVSLPLPPSGAIITKMEPQAEK